MPQAIELRHQPPPGLLFSGLDTGGALIFLLEEPFTKEQVASPEGHDWHVTVSVGRTSSLLQTETSDEDVELVAVSHVDYARLIAFV